MKFESLLEGVLGVVLVVLGVVLVVDSLLYYKSTLFRATLFRALIRAQFILWLKLRASLILNSKIVFLYFCCFFVVVVFFVLELLPFNN